MASRTASFLTEADRARLRKEIGEVAPTRDAKKPSAKAKARPQKPPPPQQQGTGWRAMVWMYHEMSLVTELTFDIIRNLPR